MHRNFSDQPKLWLEANSYFFNIRSDLGIIKVRKVTNITWVTYITGCCTTFIQRENVMSVP